MESLQTVFNSIIENMPVDLTEMEKARYLYLAVCKFYAYNPEFIVGDKQTRNELFDEDVDLKNIISNKGICSSISRALIGLYEQVGIEANGVFFKGRMEEGHMEVAFKIDEKIYEANAVSDLMNVKLGLMTEGFAKKMVSAKGKLFLGYSYLKTDEIKKLDDKIGYTYGLTDSYISRSHNSSDRIDAIILSDKMKKMIAILDEKEKKMGRAPIPPKRIYFDDVMKEIADELFDYKYFGDYVKSISPDVDIDNLSAQEQDKYRIKFVMDYINTFNGDLDEIDKRDAFEYMVDWAASNSDEAVKIFNGTNADGSMVSIIRYAGSVARDDLFYLFCEGKPITEITTDEVKKIIDDGFRTFSKGREQFIINHDKYFQETSYKYSDKMAKFLDSNDRPDEREQREKAADAVIKFQKCNEAIARYKRIVYDFQNGREDCKEKIKNLYGRFVQYVDKFGYDKYIDQIHLAYEDVGIVHLYEDLQIIKEQLEKEGEPIIKILDEYRYALKEEAIRNNIPLYHVSKLSPEQMKDGKIKPKYNTSQYNQEFDKMVFASTEDIKTNPYIFARANGKGMSKLPIRKNVYLMEQGDVNISKAGDESKEAISKTPTYVYYLPIDRFEPQILFRFDNQFKEYAILFDNEWTAKDEFALPDKVVSNMYKEGDEVVVPANTSSSEVYAVETYSNVTEILKNNQILINNGLNKDEMDTIIHGDPVFDCIENNVVTYIQNGKIKYLNGELEINAITLPSNNKTEMVYDADEILYGASNRSGKEGAVSKANFIEYVRSALDNGITQIEYADAIKARAEQENKKNGLGR